ncbi:HAD-IC family P-type ATPase [Leifsonia sp. 71-9]|uniref:HAD-IC family P-type ATPase n=1 Tax=Leifsonia sp. 71-9 TaxID=1895934 RepID=UPI0025BA1FA5|nr:HAD-IC family P-type ATPase [Leifsonia sp. 71-9]
MRIDALPPWDEDTLLTFVASAEEHSSHVLAASIVESARERGLTPLRVQRSTETAAEGVTAVLENHTVSVGTLRFARTSAPDVVEASLRGGEMAIYVVIDERAAGIVIASDGVRKNAAQTISGLRDEGVNRIVMLTGDAQTTADHIARAVGITEVRADCLPRDKVDILRGIVDRPVLMVGDGVNDSPVLASADVGIAMGARGATAASEAAAAVILLDDISVVVRAVRIGQDTVRIALQSIWIGMALSIGLMIVAAFGLIPATLGAATQEVVDLATILNALRALRDRQPAAKPASPVPVEVAVVRIGT